MTNTIFQILPVQTGHVIQYTDSQKKTISEFIMLGNNMVKGKVGERLSIRKPVKSLLTSDVQAFSESFMKNPNSLIAEWTTWDEYNFVMFEKYFSSGSYHRDHDGKYVLPGGDFYRISGDKWSILFQLSADQYWNPRYDDDDYREVLGTFGYQITARVIITGSHDEMENDLMMYTLMGHTRP